MHLANDASFEGSVPMLNVNLKLSFWELLLMMFSKKTRVELKLERKSGLEIRITTKSGNRLPGQLKYSLIVLCPHHNPYPHLA